MLRLQSSVILLLLALCLQACGQTGALTRPEAEDQETQSSIHSEQDGQ